jgi:hypothetical protein
MIKNNYLYFYCAKSFALLGKMRYILNLIIDPKPLGVKKTGTY